MSDRKDAQELEFLIMNFFPLFPFHCEAIHCERKKERERENRRKSEKGSWPCKTINKIRMDLHREYCVLAATGWWWGWWFGGGKNVVAVRYHASL